MSETKYGSEFGEAIADNSSNLSTVSTPDLRYLINSDYEPVGNTSNNYVAPGSYTGTGLTNTANFSDLTSLANSASKFLTDNKGLLTAGGAALGLLGGNNATSRPTGYQGGIPLLGATRTMMTAPPTEIGGVKRRPGSGGINYGGDVTYSRLPTNTDVWKDLSGTSGGIAGGTTAGGVTTKTGGVTTKTDGTDTKTDTANLGSAGYQAAMAAGLTPAQYLNNINQWIIDHPYADRKQIADALAQYKVSDADLQEALRTTTFSDATKYALTHDMGLADINASINNWLEKNPYATAEAIQAEQSKYGISDEDVARAMTGLNSSAAKEYAVVHDIGLDEMYKNILDFQRENPTEQQIKDAMDQYGISAADVKAAQNYAKATGYAEGGLANTNQGLANLGLSSEPVLPSIPPDNVNFNSMQFATGGMAKGRYLQGGTDGMADELPAKIGKDQPAALSHGEFVIPADVVSHMGNGNSDAGAKKLYQMMDKIRMARTGTKKQGKKINPDKFMPGGLASSKYAKGGEVKHYQTGGLTPTTGLNAGLTGTESNLSNWAGSYVTNMLGQGQALANLPYQAYTGPLTAGASPLQTGAFQTAAGLTTPSAIGDAAATAGGIATKAEGMKYTPGTTSFDATQAATYMNPYLESALKPQLEEARRQSQITQQQNASKMTQAGAFGGGRQAILDAETQRALGANLANITGSGYSTAYDKAMAQFNADQARKAQEAQFGATYGLDALKTGLSGAQTQGQLGYQQNQAGLANLAAQLEAGAAERGIESEGIAADKAQFEEARSNPYKMVQFQQSLLQGLPLAAQSYNVAAPSALTQAAQGATTVADLLDILSGKAPAKKA